MRIINLLYNPFLSGRPAVGLLLFRIVAGVALMLHGSMKMAHPFSWMGAHSAVPGLFQAASFAAEFLGGLLLIVGLLTPIACIFIAINMLTALFTVHFPHGDAWVGPGGHSFEPAMFYLGSAFLLFLAGPGIYSVDAKIFQRKLPAEATERKTLTGAGV